MMTLTNAALVKKAILIVEDSEEDFVATARALKKAGLTNPIDRCVNGDEAIQYFSEDNLEERKNLPGLILLDLNLPGTDGREVLKRLKSHPIFRKIPIVVLTTSIRRNDVDYCYATGVNSYIQKPLNIESLFQAIRTLKNYWFETSVLPTNGDSDESQ